MTSAMTIHPARDHAPPRKVRLLVADDSRAARQSVVAYLRTLGSLDVFAECQNGLEAVETALRREPDLVLLNLQMPVMSGLEAAEIFRNSMPHVGVILTSTHDRLEVREACLAGGADAFVGKDAIATQFPGVMAGVLERMGAPERHRRAPAFVTRPLTDLFAPARPIRRAGAHTPAHRPGRAPCAPDTAID